MVDTGNSVHDTLAMLAKPKHAVQVAATTTFAMLVVALLAVRFNSWHERVTRSRTTVTCLYRKTRSLVLVVVTSQTHALTSALAGLRAAYQSQTQIAIPNSCSYSHSGAWTLMTPMTNHRRTLRATQIAMAPNHRLFARSTRPLTNHRPLFGPGAWRGTGEHLLRRRFASSIHRYRFDICCGS